MGSFVLNLCSHMRSSQLPLSSETIVAGVILENQRVIIIIFCGRNTSSRQCCEVKNIKTAFHYFQFQSVLTKITACSIHMSFRIRDFKFPQLKFLNHVLHQQNASKTCYLKKLRRMFSSHDR